MALVLVYVTVSQAGVTTATRAMLRSCALSRERVHQTVCLQKRTNDENKHEREIANSNAAVRAKRESRGAAVSHGTRIPLTGL